MKRLLRLAPLLLAVPIVLAADTPWGYRHFSGVARGTSRPAVEVQATITQPECSFASPDSWCAAWIGLSSDGGGYNIVQIGYIVFPPIWHHEVHYFVAWGDQPSRVAPQAQDLGLATPGPHNFRIRVVYRDWTGREFNRVQYYVDGSLVATSPIDATPWVRTTTTVAWLCETAVPGDTCQARWWGMRYRELDGPSVRAFSPRDWLWRLTERSGAQCQRVTGTTTMALWAC
jgi:hypothetical protein